MPRIPLYNQGQGSAVRLQAGQLSRRADVGAFTAPGKALASLGGTVSDIAFQFGMAEKRAETDRVYNEALTQYGAQADEMAINPASRTVRGFEIESGEFRRKALDDINGRADLTKSQKAEISSKIGRMIDRKVSVGRGRVFDKQQTERSEIMDRGIAALISDTADVNMREEVMGDIGALIETSKQQGLKISYDMQGVRSVVRYNDALADSTNPNYKLDDLKSKKNDILNGRGEYAETPPEERSKLGRVYQQRINELEFGVTAQLKAAEADLYAQIDSTGSDNGARELANSFRDLGREDLALEVESNSYIKKVGFEFVEDSALANSETFNANLKDVMALPLTGNQAAENAKIQENAMKFAADRREKISSDSAQYVTDQLLRQGKEVTPQAILAQQKTMGIPLMPFTNEQVKQVQEQLANTPGELDRQEILRQFVYEFGDAKNPVDPELMLSLMPGAGFSFVDTIVASDPDRVINFSLLAADKADDQDLSARIKNKGFEASEINNLVAEELAGYDGAIVSGGRQSVAARTASSDAASHLLQLQETTSKLARYLVGFNNMNPKDAAKRAARLVNDKFMYPEVNKRTFVLPRKYENLSGEFANELTSMLFDDATFTNVEVGAFQGDVTGELSRERFAAEVRNGGRWATNASRSGVVLLDNTENIVVANGQPVAISFAELERRVNARKETAQTREVTIESSTERFQSLNRQLRDEFGGRDRQAAIQAGTLEEFEAEKKRLEFERDALDETIQGLRKARNR